MPTFPDAAASRNVGGNETAGHIPVSRRGRVTERGRERVCWAHPRFQTRPRDGAGVGTSLLGTPPLPDAAAARNVGGNESAGHIHVSGRGRVTERGGGRVCGAHPHSQTRPRHGTWGGTSPL